MSMAEDYVDNYSDDDLCPHGKIICDVCAAEEDLSKTENHSNAETEVTVREARCANCSESIIRSDDAWTHQYEWRPVCDGAVPVVTDNELGGCGYQGYEFGAGAYPDSICVEGRLFDADDCDDQGRLYMHKGVEDVPCPVCRPADAIGYWTNCNQNTGASRRDARAAAKSLVTDILKNRGKWQLAEETKRGGS